ncbi:MAG TPA: hypothetical protein VFP65_27445 [Anaeromyxobacteraceae bacterium]|nr:hypothetical protein [Anaeromyxobacteraceae bacterium]
MSTNAEIHPLLAPSLAAAGEVKRPRAGKRTKATETEPPGARARASKAPGTRGARKTPARRKPAGKVARGAGRKISRKRR